VKGLRAWTVGSLAALGCAPSFQAVYECDVHFEHCYALDQGDSSDDAKRQCWRDWLHGYTYGQPRDRVEYARSRMRDGSLEPPLATVAEPLASAEPPRSTGTRSDPSRSSGAALLPRSAFTPPPIVNVVDGEGGSAATAKTGEDADGAKLDGGVPSRVPGADCARSCEEHWSGCRDACKASACVECDSAYRRCARSCFRE
jgi:hypothetical protein